jgi:dipeptidase
MINTINAIKDSLLLKVRPIAVPQCAYVHLIQIRNNLPEEIAAIAYFANDNPAQSPRLPIYAAILQTPEPFHLSGHKHFTPHAAAWIYRQANKLATIRWQESRIKLEKLRNQFEDTLFTQQPQIDAQALHLLKTQGKQALQQYLTDYLRDFSNETLDAWTKLRDELWYTLIRGL